MEATGLLIGGVAENDGTVGDGSGPGPGPDDREHHRVEVLHVDSAAAPHVAVPNLAAERVDPPVRRLRGHHVEMPVDQQRVVA